MLQSLFIITIKKTEKNYLLQPQPFELSPFPPQQQKTGEQSARERY